MTATLTDPPAADRPPAVDPAAAELDAVLAAIRLAARTADQDELPGLDRADRIVSRHRLTRLARGRRG